jgi:hypothetical protein
MPKGDPRRADVRVGPTSDHQFHLTIVVPRMGQSTMRARVVFVQVPFQEEDDMSKTVGASALAIIVTAGTASAAGPFEPIPVDQRGIVGRGLLSADQYTLDKIPLGSQSTRATDVYNGIEFNSNYFAPTTSVGYIGFDDYDTSTAPGGSYGGGVDFMTRHLFVGGMTGGTGDSGVMFFTFFTEFGTPFDSYGVVLPADGAGYYGITITGGMYIPSNGIAQAWVNDNPANFGGAFNVYPGYWFYSEGAPTVGGNDSAFGAFAPFYNMHTIEVPAPASLAMLGLGGALAVRRRR